MLEHRLVLCQIILKNNNNTNSPLFIATVLQRQKSSPAEISKQKYKLLPYLVNTSGCLWAGVGSPRMVATGGK